MSEADRRHTLLRQKDSALVLCQRHNKSLSLALQILIQDSESACQGISSGDEKEWFRSCIERAKAAVAHAADGRD
ncbi:MAG: hypothetical protein EOP04_30030 [Proteobacteria bacterium]|nr:MAG: hypothetical protein EOP04_30030 [Pseudomonadota bacterium]